MKAIIFDTETTGLVNNRTIMLSQQPWVIEFCGQLWDLATGEKLGEFTTLVKPNAPFDLSKRLKKDSDKTIQSITGISNEMLADAPLFSEVAPKIKELVTSAAPLAHNLPFDSEMLSIEYERLGDKEFKLPQGFCTVEQTMHLRGYRLTLSKLYALLFNGETFEAHRASSDVNALARVACELFQRGML